MNTKKFTLDYSEEELVNLTKAIIYLWAEEEFEANSDSGVSMEQRILENTESYLENLSANLRKG